MSAERHFFVIGSMLAGTAVAAGAFGTHVLESRIAPSLLEAFATGARYQLVHGVALLVVAWGLQRWPHAGLTLAGWLLAVGTVVFSGSLYLLALTGARWLGAVTPLGGAAMIAGWAVLAWRSGRAGH